VNSDQFLSVDAEDSGREIVTTIKKFKKKEALLVEDTSRASWALKGGTQVVSVPLYKLNIKAGDFEALPPICEFTDVRAAVDVPACLESSQRTRSQQIDSH
jgi:hypothetical protein